MPEGPVVPDGPVMPYGPVMPGGPVVPGGPVALVNISCLWWPQWKCPDEHLLLWWLE